MRLSLIILLLLLPVALGVDLPECQRTIYTDKIPCIVVSTYRPISGCTANVSIYSQNGSLNYSKTWADYTPNCAYVWDISRVGTYAYNSTVEDGNITVERKDNMLSIIILQIFLVCFFIFLGLPHKFGFLKFLSWAMALMEIVVGVWMVYINEINGTFSNIMYINALAVLVLGGIIGVLTILVLIAKFGKVDEDNQIADDEYTKWVTE